MSALLQEAYELPAFAPLAVVVPIAQAGAATLARAELAARANQHDAALELLAEVRGIAGDPELMFRRHLVESWSQMALGRLDDALEQAHTAHELSHSPRFTDVDRAEALFHLGCCRFKRSETSLAASLLSVAIEMCDRSPLPCDRLRADALQWRSRCYQIQRDWTAARGDLDRALELTASLDDPATTAHVYFQASAVAERTSDLHLARYYAEEAKAIFQSIGDKLMLARITNNLGGLMFLMDEPTAALLELEDALQLGLEIGSHADIAQATSSVAQIHLRTGRPDLAEQQARNALDGLAGRPDFLSETGNAQLVLARVLILQERHQDAEAMLRAADATFEKLGSVSHRAAVSVARGDCLRGQCREVEAGDHYRRAAEALQDFRF
jgi:tetratricopeptide (TPR) repeat protein